ncbi:hypothetical protein [Streptomyces sp. NPDC001985]|uniref:hypothetical protein n=1 Tax=Streptomyces sp. NPDC001985 TaxID=3154406 RepID=UPI00331F54BA
MGLNEVPRAPRAEVRVEIGTLVLGGFGRLDPERVSEAFQRELSRLVRERGVPLAGDGDRALEALSGLPPLPATASPARLGEALARAVHSGLSGLSELPAPPDPSGLPGPRGDPR